MCDWRIMHGNIIKSFILFLNSMSNQYILKGGTSLMLCYGLTRFSEDIDLDALCTKDIELVLTFLVFYVIILLYGKELDTYK